MLLYHGTTAAVARKAIAGAGLLPRRQSKRSNWTNCPSHPDAVYLTNAYPLYFAAQHKVAVCAVVEIDSDRLNPFQLAPDEDVLEQCGRGHDSLPKGWTMRQRTVWYRNQLRTYARDGDKWETSIRGMGTCCHLGAIPPEAMTRVAFVECFSDATPILWEAINAQISLANYKWCGERYRALTASLWADPTPPGVTIQDVAP